MSAAENKALMARIYDGINRGDPSLFVERLAEDATVTVTGANSWSRTFNGKAAAREGLWGYVRSLLVKPGQTVPFRILADEDWVVMEARGDMTTKQGEKYENDYCLIFRLKDGRIVEMREYLDSALCERVLGPYPASVPGDASERGGDATVAASIRSAPAP